MRHSVQSDSELSRLATTRCSSKPPTSGLRGRGFPYMGAHIVIAIWKGQMKTTVEISDALLREVRQVAAREGVTLRNLVERGLHRVLAETKNSVPFKLRRASFKGRGRQAELREASWDTLRDLTYQDRGA